MPRKKNRKKSFEIKFYERLVNNEPNFAEALSCLGEAYTRGGLFNEGLEVDLRLAKLKPDDPVVYYNLACSYSLLGRIDEAFSALKKSILLGYEDFSYILKDKDLENIRRDKRFLRLMNKINSRFLKAKSIGSLQSEVR
ncbi:MAG: tetratricopeptide repeat protein [Candidatus Omnitrophica bacterium]|nr:tetratricopeptide repeat protein [Candidatus Omnitrophota bacterium]